jgi:mRNA interferase MazF
MASDKPVRGEIWDVDLEPVLGHELGRRRPALVVSVDQFNQGSSGLVIIVPITSKDKRIRSQVAIDAGQGGLNARNFAMCEAVRSISLERLIGRRGEAVSLDIMKKVAYCLQVLLGI